MPRKKKWRKTRRRFTKLILSALGFLAIVSSKQSSKPPNPKLDATDINIRYQDSNILINENDNFNLNSKIFVENSKERGYIVKLFIDILDKNKNRISGTDEEVVFLDSGESKKITYKSESINSRPEYVRIKKVYVASKKIFKVEYTDEIDKELVFSI
jgi:hypothetical protein